MLQCFNDLLCCFNMQIKPFLKFNNEFNVGDVVSFASVILAVIGGFFGYHQWKKSIKIKRGEYINELTEKIRTDDDIREIVYIFDYDQNWYNDSFHKSGEFERKVDKTLSYFSYICYLFENDIIEKSEFAFFEYEINRILRNFSTIEYFYNIYHFSEKCHAPMTFKYLFKYGEKIGIYDNEFFNNNSQNYNHYINF